MKIKGSFPRRWESRLVPVKTGNNRVEKLIPAGVYPVEKRGRNDKKPLFIF
jgi:hypothetical protein